MHLFSNFGIFCDVLLIVIHVLLCFCVLVALHFYIFRDRYTVHSCLFAEDGAFILASTLVPVEEFDDQSAWLRVVNGRSTFLIDT